VEKKKKKEGRGVSFEKIQRDKKKKRKEKKKKRATEDQLETRQLILFSIKQCSAAVILHEYLMRMCIASELLPRIACTSTK
jgi:hypothetical protein